MNSIQLQEPETNRASLNYEFQRVLEDFNFVGVAEAFRKLELKLYDHETKADYIPDEAQLREIVIAKLRILMEGPSVAEIVGCYLSVRRFGDKLCVSFVPYESDLWDPLYSKVSDEFRVQSMHPMVKGLLEVVRKLPWIGDVNYPSNAARRHDLGDNYLAISEDGLLSALFEVLSFEGEGSLRRHHLEGAESACMERFLDSVGVRHDTILSFAELKQRVEDFIVLVLREREKGFPSMKKHTVKAVVVDGGKAVLRKIDQDLKTLQSLVGGYIEQIQFGRHAVAIINEEGKLRNLPPNDVATLMCEMAGVGLRPEDRILGPMVIFGNSDEDTGYYTDVPESVLSTLKIES